MPNFHHYEPADPRDDEFEFPWERVERLGLSAERRAEASDFLRDLRRDDAAEKALNERSNNG